MRVAVVGLGPIGLEVARGIFGRPTLRLAACVDVAPPLAGRSIAELVGAGEGTVDATLEAALKRDVDAIALCTGSRVVQVAPDIARAVAGGKHVVSTCEELALPGESPEAAAIADAARRAGVTVFGTGVNPGFVMDRLPMQLAGACVRVDAVRVERVVDAALRREPLRRKVGHGLTVEAFREGVAAGQLGHVGLRASAELLARGLGSKLSSGDERIEPVVGEDGRVLGVFQRLLASTEDGRPIELTLQMSVGAPSPHDRIEIDGDPPLRVQIEGGTHGDRATAGAVLDGLERLPRAPRGLVTVVEVY